MLSEGLGTVVQETLAILKVLTTDSCGVASGSAKTAPFHLQGDELCSLSSYFNGKATVLCGISFMLFTCRESP